MKRASLVAALALIAAGPAFASPTAAADAQAKADKVVCKRIVETGSLVRGSRICKTRRAWDSEGQAARKQTHDMQNQSLINTRAPQ